VVDVAFVADVPFVADVAWVAPVAWDMVRDMGDKLADDDPACEVVFIVLYSEL